MQYSGVRDEKLDRTINLGTAFLETKEGSSVEEFEAVLDPGEGPGGRPPIIFRPKLFLRPAPPLSQSLDDPPPIGPLSEGLDPPLRGAFLDRRNV